MCIVFTSNQPARAAYQAAALPKVWTRSSNIAYCREVVFMIFRPKSEYSPIYKILKKILTPKLMYPLYGKW